MKTALRCVPGMVSECYSRSVGPGKGKVLASNNAAEADAERIVWVHFVAPEEVRALPGLAREQCRGLPGAAAMEREALLAHFIGTLWIPS